MFLFQYDCVGSMVVETFHSSADWQHMMQFQYWSADLSDWKSVQIHFNSFQVPLIRK